MLKNLLIFSDLHISKDSLDECGLILDEYKSLIKQYNIDTVIDCGDTFHIIKPTSQELDLFSSFLTSINIPTIIISAQSHESEDFQNSIINHFGILNQNIKVIKEYQDGNKLYCGHFGLRESKLQKFGSTHSIQEFSKFRWVILGHFHNFEQVEKNCVQLGSSRFISFDEVKGKQKIVLLIENYDSEQPKCSFLALKSPYPMIDIHLQKLLENEATKDTNPPKIVQPTLNAKGIEERKGDITSLCSYLDQLFPKSKVRVNFYSFGDYLNFLPYYEKYKSKFVIFKHENNFESNSIIENIKESRQDTKFIVAFKKWLEEQKVNEEVKKILMEKIK